jgi:hypothetical protein
MPVTAAKFGRRVACPRCRAPKGERCWDLKHHWPGGDLRHLPGEPFSAPRRNRHNHHERLQLARESKP